MICARDDRDQILAQLPNTPLRRLAAQYHVSRSALQRHRTQGCPAERQSAPTAAAAATGAELAQVIRVLTEIKALLEVSVQQSRHAVDDDYTGTVAPRLEWNRL